MEIARFEDYYNEVAAMPNQNLDALSVGCYDWNIDDGFFTNDYSYVGPDPAETASSNGYIIKTASVMIIAVIGMLLY